MTPDEAAKRNEASKSLLSHYDGMINMFMDLHEKGTIDRNELDHSYLVASNEHDRLQRQILVLPLAEIEDGELPLLWWDGAPLLPTPL